MSGHTGIGFVYEFTRAAEILTNVPTKEHSFGVHYTTVIIVDGVRHQFDPSDRHVVPASPGSHHVEIYFFGGGTTDQLLGETFKRGRTITDVRVEANKVTWLKYSGDFFWHFGRAGEIRATEPPEPV